MARRRYYRVRRIIPKQKWLLNINEIPINGSIVASTGARLLYNTITQNATRTGDNAQGGISSASILKVGRFRYKGNILTSVPGFTYIIGLSYIPEGYSLSTSTGGYTSTDLGTSFFYRHPEWILCWTRIDYNSDSQRNEFSLSSRLKRNLNSGDAIIAFVIVINNSTQDTVSSNINGTVSYVCRTN